MKSQKLVAATLIGVLSIAGMVSLSFADSVAEQPTAGPTAKPTTGPTTQPVQRITGQLTEEQQVQLKEALLQGGAKAKPKAKISAEAQTELDAMAAAYSNLKSLQLSGTLNVNFEVAGETEKKSAEFTGSYQSPNRFKHAMTNDLLIGSTGEKSYLYSEPQKMYMQIDAPKTKEEFTKNPSDATAALSQQNPSLLLALSDKPAQELIAEATEVNKIADVKLEDKTYSALAIKSEANDIRVLIDPTTHLIRQLQIDLARQITAQGAPDVKTALATLDYTSIVRDPDLKSDHFAWSPPEGAKDAATVRGEMGAGADPSTLVGKPAPEFAAPGLDDKQVTIQDLKGQVVIVDFWATWCGPCVVGLPALDKLYQDKKAAGLKVFAINQGEDKETAQAFVTKTKLGVPVLLDAPGKIGEAYLVQGIPQTVLIGKDGNVKKVVVGFNPAEVELLHKAVEAELAAK